MRNFVAGSAALLFFAALPILAAPSACDAVVGNLVMNCGFETGTFADWTLSGNTILMYVDNDAAFAHTGSSSAALGPVGSDGYLTQTLATTAGNTYQLQFWLKDDGFTPNDFDVSLDGGATELYSATNIAAHPYTAYTFSFVATGSTALQFSSRDDNSYLHLDDIVVTPATPSAVPEPASVVLLLSLLAVAGIALRRRIGHRPAN